MSLSKYIDKKTIVTMVVSIVIGAVTSIFITRQSNFLLYYGGNIKVETYDICLDTLADMSLMDQGGFKPRAPKYLVVHCTDSKRDMSKAELWDVFISRWGKNTKPGYNYAVNKKGELYTFAPVDKSPVLEWDEVVYGAAGYNSVSVHIAYIGGHGKDDRTESQKAVLRTLIMHFKTLFPDIQVLGHRDLPKVAKTCPNFNVLSDI